MDKEGKRGERAERVKKVPTERMTSGRQSSVYNARLVDIAKGWRKGPTISLSLSLLSLLSCSPSSWYPFLPISISLSLSQSLKLRGAQENRRLLPASEDIMRWKYISPSISISFLPSLSSLCYSHYIPPLSLYHSNIHSFTCQPKEEI